MNYNWNTKKNEILKRERNISFEDILSHIWKGDLSVSNLTMTRNDTAISPSCL